MKDKKLIIDLQEIVKEQVYRKLMDIHWMRLEEFKEEIHAKIDRDSRFVAEVVTKDLLKIIEQQKDKENVK